MGTASTFFYTKERNTITVDDIVRSGNSIFDAIENSGMVKVANDVVPGQCNRLVSVATSDPLDAVVTIEVAATSSAQRKVKGQKVFRHPHMGFYLRVFVCEVGSTATVSCVNPYFQYAQEIDAQGNFVNPLTLYPKPSGFSWSWSPSYGGLRVGTQLTLRASCGVDHFVLAHSADAATFEQIQSSTTLAASKVGFSTGNLAICKVGQSHNIILLPRTVVESSSYIQDFQVSSYTATEMGLQRKWLVNTVDGTWSYMGAIQNVSAMTELGVISDKYGVRVAQMLMTIDGERVPIPIGCVHAGAVSDMDIVTINLDGNGDRQYFASHGFGTTNWLPGNTVLEKIPVMLLPWGD